MFINKTSMKKITFLFVFISMFGYAQTPISNDNIEEAVSKWISNPTGKETTQAFRFLKKISEKSKVLDSIIYYNYTDRSLNDSIRSKKYFYTYDSNNNRTLSETYNWDDTTNDWKANYKYVSTYDSNNNLTLTESYNWDDTANDWKKDYKWVGAHDSNNNRTLYEYYEWDDTTNDWKGDYIKSVRAYDSNNNQTLSETYDWDDATNDWKGNSKYVYSFDSNNNQTLSETYDWDDTTNNWYRSGTRIFYYSESHLSTTKATLEVSLLLYPNPASNMLNIDSNNSKVSKVEIYTITGKKVLSIKNTNTINVQALPSGVYTIRISDGVRQTNRKFIKN